MSILTSAIQHELTTLKPEDIGGIVLPAAESLLKGVGGQDLDHDGQPDYQEALGAAGEVADALEKLARLAQAYRAKYIPKK